MSKRNPKTKRNAPCPCGSGRKYKKCCGKKEEGARIMSDETPKNEFRREVEKRNVSEQEMIERDQRVTYLRFKCQAEMQVADRLHTEAAIEKCKVLGNQIFQLPNSEARTGILEENKKHIEALEKQVAAQKANRAQQTILSLLEEKFGEVHTINLPSGKDSQNNGEPEELKDD